ncbi:MAG: energy-coupling factor transporter transmembrane protein EcfT [Calditrichaeota bacterium]|nr:energy-coupling factor transporter transmembrane protein EcfT [Calditrichota bacterium]
MASMSSFSMLEPRTKLALAAIFILGLLLVDEMLGLVPIVAAILLLAILARLPVRSTFVGLVGFCPLLFLTILVHGLTDAPAEGNIVRSGFVSFTTSGLSHGLFFAIRLLLFVLVSRVILALGSAEDYARALGRLFAPLRRLRVPVGETELVIGIALRLIPTLENEANRLLLARQARGLAPGRVGRIRQLPAILVPLFVGAFRHADALAVAMEARGFAVGVTRSSYMETHFRALDFVVLSLAVATVTLALALT